MPPAWLSALLLFEAEVAKLEGAAVLRDGPDYHVRRPVGDVGVDVDGDTDRRPRQARQVLHDLVGDRRGVAMHPEGLDLDSAVEAAVDGLSWGLDQEFIFRDLDGLPPVAV